MSTCTNCGYTHAISPELSAGPRSPMASIAGARSKLETATQDLFRLSGNSIPVDASSLAPAPRKSEPELPPVPMGSAQSEASIIFSLEELMKTGTPSSPSKPHDDEPDQLWSMQAATPIFGTAQDLALLTAPAQPAKGSSLDSMTLESVRPAVRRWLPIGLGLAGVGLLAASALAFWPGSGSADASAESAAATELAPAAEPEAPAEAAAENPPPSAGDPPPAVAPEVPAADAPPAADGPAGAEAAADDAADEADEDEADEADDDEDANEVASSKPSRSKKKSRWTRKKKAAARKVSSAAKGPFDTSAARRSLSAAAKKAAACRTGGAGGSGKVQLTFATSGKVSSAKIVGGALSKAASSCALRHFRAARVPAFTGSAQTVAKSFKIP